MTYGQGTIEKHIHEHGPCFHKCISWGAIIAGALVGIGLSFLLNLFSVAIGLSVFSMTRAGVTGLAVGGLIAIAIGVIISTFLSGLTAGYLGRHACPKRNLGILYGFITWCVALLLLAVVASNLGHYVTSYGNFITNPTTIIVSETGMERPSTQARQNTGNPVAVEREANTFGVGAFILFFCFFVGAVASCFGGHCGMMCKDNDYERRG